MQSQWAEWASWSGCSKSCGACGVRYRVRQCLRPPCFGDGQQFQKCGFTTCPGETTCTKLNFFDQPCGPFNTELCSQVVEVLFDCNLPSCCPPYAADSTSCVIPSAEYNTWAPWSSWGDCIGPQCGGCAVQARHRVCQGTDCPGDGTAYRRCRTKACTDCDTTSASNVGDASATSAFYSEFYNNCRSSNTIEACDAQQNLFRDEKPFECPCCQPLKPLQGYCVP